MHAFLGYEQKPNTFVMGSKSFGIIWVQFVSNILKHSKNLLYSKAPSFYEYSGFSKQSGFTITS
jgi:hypothetical protein